MKKRNEKWFIEVIFWLSVLLFLLPIGAYFYTKSQFDNHISNQSLTVGWEISGAEVKLENQEIPTDLKYNSVFGGVGEIIYQKRIGLEQFRNFSQPALVIGRIGDLAKITINGCVLQSEGEKKSSGWWWGALRYTSVPFGCLREDNNLRVDVKHWGFANKGIYDGPIGIGDYSSVKNFVSKIEFLKYGIFFVFGLLILVSGFLYYLFVFLLVPKREYYLPFSLFAFFTGMYEICVSTVPYRYFGDGTLGLQVNFVSACLASMFLFEFFHVKFRFRLNRARYIVYGLFGLILLASFFYSDIKKIFGVYQLWFSLFLIYVTYFSFSLVYDLIKRKNLTEWRYLVGLMLFLVSLYFDIVSSSLHRTEVYLIPYGFIILLCISSLTLASEAAHAFLNVEEQVAERTSDLSKAIEDLKGLEKMKDRFFANISHDLKTPITIALGAIEETQTKLKSVVGKMLDPADRALRRLQDMVMGILDSVKAESGSLTLEWKSVRVVDFIQSIVETYSGLCRREGVKLLFDPRGFEGLYVPMDAGKMQRVIENLLSNALKFTRKSPNGQRLIEVKLETDQAKLSIHIDDSGIGIPAQEREKVFERYFQSSRTDLREHGGSGIGLSFVREMVNLHNGKVFAEDSPYQGTRITMELPLSQDIENIQSYRIEDLSNNNLRGSLDVEYPPTTPKQKNPAFPTLLCAEDNPEVAQVVYSCLKGHYNIYFAENGKRALQILPEHTFDCVVTDLQMPEMTGHELVKAIRSQTSWKSIPIVILSSHGDDDTVIKLLGLGANDYVQKPFRREILLSRVQAQINAYRGTTWNTKLEKLQELGQLVSGIGHQGKNRISRIGSNYPLLIKIASDLAKKMESLEPVEGKRIREKVEALGGLIGKGYEQTLSLFKAIDRYASGSDYKSNLSIDEVVKDTITLLEDKIRAKNINIVTSGIEHLEFEGYNEFREALLNIISNSVDAIDHNQGEIHVIGQDLGHEIMITISDNGMGIPKENLRHVFEAFFTSKVVGQGTGLGLYLARDAVELKNGGQLTIESKGIGQGASVHIRVPKIVPDVEKTRPTMHNVGV